MKQINLSDYQKRATKTFKDHDSHKDEVCDWLISLSEEVGEVQSLFKHDFYGGEPVKKEELAKEIGDVLWYLAALCTSNGIDMGVAAQLNVEKLEHRFGGGTFSKEASQNRHQLESRFSETDVYKELISNLELTN